jgi:hypothetical protein
MGEGAAGDDVGALGGGLASRAGWADFIRLLGLGDLLREIADQAAPRDGQLDGAGWPLDA